MHLARLVGWCGEHNAFVCVAGSEFKICRTSCCASRSTPTRDASPRIEASGSRAVAGVVAVSVPSSRCGKKLQIYA